MKANSLLYTEAEKDLGAVNQFPAWDWFCWLTEVSHLSPTLPFPAVQWSLAMAETIPPQASLNYAYIDLKGQMQMTRSSPSRILPRCCPALGLFPE